THDMPAFVARARALGLRHRSCGVIADDYPLVGRALVDAAHNLFADVWTADDADAWRRFYRLISDAMLEGAASDLFNPTVHPGRHNVSRGVSGGVSRPSSRR